MTSLLPTEAYTNMPYILIGIGFLIGIFSAFFGRSFYLSAPILHVLLPQLSLGQIVGNLKLGTLFRGLGTFLITRPDMAFRNCFSLCPLLLAGTITGVAVIAGLAASPWLLVVIVLAMVMNAALPKLAARMPAKSFPLLSFLTGIYAGMFGAGIGGMLTTLLCGKNNQPSDIVTTKMQARLIELIIAIVAITTHFFYGHLVLDLWLPLAIGTFGGGMLGGLFLMRNGMLSMRVQKTAMLSAMIFALIVMGFQIFA